MTGREASRPTRLTYILLAVIILAGIGIRVAYYRVVDLPFPPDAAYYAHVARNMAAGEGCVVKYAWVYARGVPESFPTPAMGYWMPGMSFYLVPWIWALGPSLTTVKLANTVLLIPFMALIWWLGRIITGRDGPGLLGAAFAALDPHLTSASGSADASMPQAVLACGALLCMYYGLYRNPRWLGLAGLLAGLGHFMRNDGALLIPVMGLCALAAWRQKAYKFHWAHVLYFVLPYALAVAPWMIRNTVVFGSPSPPHMNRLFILPTYEDLFRTDWSTITVQQWLDQHNGWLGVLKSDVNTLWLQIKWLVTTGAGVVLLFAVPYLLVKRPTVARPYLYLLGIVAVVYSFVFPELGIKGSFVRSFIGVQPLVLALGGAGVWLAAEWLGERLKRVPVNLAVALLTVVLLGYMGQRLGERVARQRQELTAHPYVGNLDGLRAFFSQGDQSLAIMADDPWTLHWLTKRPTYMLPRDGMEGVLKLARDKGIRYLSLPGAYRVAYPGFEEAVDDGTLECVRAFPTLAKLKGLQVFDLWLTEARRLNAEGKVALEAGDLVLALEHFEESARLVADHPDAGPAAARRLALTLVEHGEVLEAEGRPTEAAAQYRRALDVAPEGVDLSEAAEKLQALEALP